MLPSCDCHCSAASSLMFSSAILVSVRRRPFLDSSMRCERSERVVHIASASNLSKKGHQLPAAVASLRLFEKTITAVVLLGSGPDGAVGPHASVCLRGRPALCDGFALPMET